MSLHDELTIDVSQIAPVHLELELEPARSHDLVGPYGAFVATMAPADLAPPAWGTNPHASSGWQPPAPRLAPPSAVGRFLDALAALPVGVWNRLALYGFLFSLFGNVLRCGGLSIATNVSCAIVVALGIAGIVACAQRSP